MITKVIIFEGKEETISINEKIKEAKTLLGTGSYFLDEIRNSYRLGLGSFTIA